MYRNYLTTAVRNLLQRKGYSLINIIGLAVGMASCLMIYLYVSHEFSYDTYHSDADRIYRVSTIKKTQGREESLTGAGWIAATALQESFPQVEVAGRLAHSRPYVVTYGDKAFFEERLGAADPGALQILHIPFAVGDPVTALERPHTAVITENLAVKYFGDEAPVGRTITIDTTKYEITGVVEDAPSNTHWHYGIITSLVSREGMPWVGGWGGFFPTYVKLAPGTDVAAFEKAIARLPHEYPGEPFVEEGSELTFFLQPLTDIHLHSHLIWELEPPGNLTTLFVLIAIGVLILLIAAMNFMNLTTARSANRSGEVGVRKVVGARRSQLVAQFLGEAVLLAALAAILALVIVDLTLPMFNQLAGSELSLQRLGSAGAILVVIGMVIAVGVFAGAYPALFLSAFKPAVVIKGRLAAGSRSGVLRKILVTGQFILSLVLVIASLTVYRQVNYLKDRPLGFEQEHKLVVGLDHNAVTPDNAERVKSTFAANPAIEGATLSSSVPGRWMYRWRVWEAGKEEESKGINCFQLDFDFQEAYDLDLVAGRFYERDRGEDVNGWGLVVNEAAVAAFGWEGAEDALGRYLWREGRTVIGVTRDFHFRGLQEAVEPVIMLIITDDYKYLTLNVRPGQAAGAVAFVQETYPSVFPNRPAEYFFLDDDFNRQYQAEEQLGRVCGAFTILGLLVACLGLFGLVSFMAEQRTREIGIRKVLGASAGRIVALLSREFVILVLLANLIAWPVAWYASRLWLEDFAYRVVQSWTTFAAAGAVALVAAFLTVGFQAVRAAMTDPAKAIKYE